VPFLLAAAPEVEIDGKILSIQLKIFSCMSVAV
jgi:hypothetical protein